MTSAGLYAEPELANNKANYTPFWPISMLKHTAQVHPERIAVIHGVAYELQEDCVVLDASIHDRARRDCLDTSG